MKARKITFNNLFKGEKDGIFIPILIGWDKYKIAIIVFNFGIEIKFKEEE